MRFKKPTESYCKRCGTTIHIRGDYCRPCQRRRIDDPFDPDDDLGTPTPKDLPRDHPSNDPTSGYRPGDK